MSELKREREADTARAVRAKKAAKRREKEAAAKDKEREREQEAARKAEEGGEFGVLDYTVHDLDSDNESSEGQSSDESGTGSAAVADCQAIEGRLKDAALYLKGLIEDLEKEAPEEPGAFRRRNGKP